jgi:hypothetical protein
MEGWMSKYIVRWIDGYEGGEQKNRKMGGLGQVQWLISVISIEVKDEEDHGS